MKNDSFKKWEPINDIPAELFLDSITDDHTGLTVILRGENSDDAIVFKFGLFVLSNQSTTETCILKTLDDYLLLKSEWPLFVSNESVYIDWLVDQSYKIIEGPLVVSLQA